MRALIRFKRAINLIGNMGYKYVFFRIYYEFKKKSGLIKFQFPTSLKTYSFINLEKFRILNSPYGKINKNVKNKDNLAVDAQRILENKRLYFSNEWISLDTDNFWHLNPKSNYVYDKNIHWSEINDFSKEQGDIKYVWENSRFNFITTLIKYDHIFKQNSSEYIFSQIEHWIDSNPVNKGPNWICSQEISIRIINWSFALYYYRNEKSLNKTRWNKIQNCIYWSLNHVFQNINFSRFSVRNNHAITETLFLALSEILFPFIRGAKKWSRIGQKYFEDEVDYQIYNDGTYLQSSLNYHRVVVQLLNLAIFISEKSNRFFNSVIYEKAYKSLFFLYQCTNDVNGYVPNYGMNDGGWFFKLSNTDYGDFRPQINTLNKLLTGNFLFHDKNLIEDFLNDLPYSTKKYKSVKKSRLTNFVDGGYYLFNDTNSKTFIRCCSYRDRPYQSDNLHIDIWIDGINFFRDSGTFMYNTKENLNRFFNGVAGHNTVGIDADDQMLKGKRFIWYNWIKKSKAEAKLKSENYFFNGQINAFRNISNNIYHERSVMKKIDKNVWIIEDKITGLSMNKFNLFWHPNPDHLKNIDIQVTDKNNNKLKPLKLNTWFSNFYGKKHRSTSLKYVSPLGYFKTTIIINQ